MPAGRPSTLTDEVISRTAELAEIGLPGPSIAARLGIPYSTWARWIKIGKESDNTTQEGRLLEVINKGASELTQRYLNSLHGQADNGNVNAITWLLTHNPLTRDQWSDAAAERRTVQRTLTSVVAAIDAAGLSDDQRTRLLLTMQAQGIGVQGGEG